MYGWIASNDANYDAAAITSVSNGYLGISVVVVLLLLLYCCCVVVVVVLLLLVGATNQLY